ncbi:MAG: iron ABC transporter permease [Anaerolineales bacterium]|jgi:iron(III) transport system permease protein
MTQLTSQTSSPSTSETQAKSYQQGRFQPSARSLLGLWLPSSLAAGAVLLPILYLLLRASQAEGVLDLILRSSTLATLGRSVWLAFAVTSGSVALALPIAWLTTRTDLPLRRLWVVLTALPIVIPSYVGAYLLVSTIGPRGMVQNWLEPFGIERLPEIYGFPGAFYILTILSYPYVLLSVRAALQNLDPTQEEAARGLGLSPWQTFWRVTLPQLRPAITGGGLLVALYVLRDFGAVSVMRYNTFTRVIYIQYSSTFDRTAAAVLALVLVTLTLILLLLEQKTRGGARYYSSSATIQRKPGIIKLKRWKAPAVVFVSVVVIAGVAIPALNLFYWLVRGLLGGEVISDLWIATRNSISASGLAAAGTLLAALPVAIVSVRYPNRASKIIERVTYIAFALPGIVIALALVFFGANYASLLYQTLPLLVFAYLILFLPEATGAVRASLLQVHPNMEEAGRSLGHHPLQVFRKITLPLVRPGIGAGAALVFLTTMKELPATLILAPIGFKTLATGVWGAVSEAFFAQAAAPALLIVLVSSLPTAILIFKENKPRNE